MTITMTTMTTTIRGRWKKESSAIFFRCPLPLPQAHSINKMHGPLDCKNHSLIKIGALHKGYFFYYYQQLASCQLAYRSRSWNWVFLPANLTFRSGKGFVDYLKIETEKKIEKDYRLQTVIKNSVIDLLVCYLYLNFSYYVHCNHLTISNGIAEGKVLIL